MYQEFSPDFIIGSNVSENNINPSEDDLLSQMKAAMVRETTFEIPCESGIMIKHEREIGTFDFGKVQDAIEQGYLNTVKMIDSIKFLVKIERSSESLAESRAQFKKSIFPIEISKSNSIYEDGKKAVFVNYALSKKLNRQKLNEEELKAYYFQLYGTPQIKYILPTLSAQKDSTYELNFKVRRTRDLSLSVGGHVSSRPVNMGYIGLSYYHVNRLAWRVHAESYFGKFYGSGKALIDIHFPTRLPFVLTPYFTLNRWDYFRSFATFFEPVRPSFLVQEEMHTGAKIQVPLSMTVKAGLDFKYFDLTDRYYQTENFSPSDTADFTNFYGRSAILSVGHNSMNRKQYASEGSRLNVSLRIVQGIERSVSGSTAPIPFDEEFRHQWVNFQFEAHKYFTLSSKFAFGMHGLAAFNSQSLFRNYVASILAMTDFSPIPDAKTFFMEEYRAPQYMAGGLNQVFSVVKNLDFRVDAYLFQPIVVLRNNADGTFQYSQYQLQPKFMGSSSLIYHSLLGPIRATLNYFPEQKEPLSFLLSFGYILFNDRAIR
jgi:NTE family protein